MSSGLQTGVFYVPPELRQEVYELLLNHKQQKAIEQLQKVRQQQQSALSN